jgi:hypothetical protein
MDHPELADCRDAHRELQRRIEDLDVGSFTAGAIQDSLDGIMRARSGDEAATRVVACTNDPNADGEMLQGRWRVHHAAAAAVLLTTALVGMRALRRG